MKTQRLMRTWYTTDATDDEPDYLGAFSADFPAETPARRIVSVDWSTRGEVMVTWLINGSP